MRKVETLDLPEVRLSYKQKLILDVLQDEFHGSAFGPQLLKESESEAIKQLSINEITWHMLRLRDVGLVRSEKQNYDGRILNNYSTTEFINYGVVKIK